jgi:hypothetical protein
VRRYLADVESAPPQRKSGCSVLRSLENSRVGTGLPVSYGPSPGDIAGGFLSGKYSRTNPAPAGSRFQSAGQFVPFDKEMGYRVVDVLEQVSARHGTSPASVALAWTLGGPAVTSVIIAARTTDHLEQNIRATDSDLSEDDVRLLDAVSDPGIPYPKWMVLQLDTAEEPRPRVLDPERYAKGGPWNDLREDKWSG